jgi:hypothetical protein
MFLVFCNGLTILLVPSPLYVVTYILTDFHTIRTYIISTDVQKRARTSQNFRDEVRDDAREGLGKYLGNRRTAGKSNVRVVENVQCQTIAGLESK